MNIVKSVRKLAASLATASAMLALAFSPALAASLPAPGNVHVTGALRSPNVYCGNISYITITWDPVPGATSYHLQVDTSPQFQWGVEEADVNTNSAVIPVVTNPKFAMPCQEYSELEDITITARNGNDASPPAHLRLAGYPGGYVSLSGQVVWTAWSEAGVGTPPFNQPTVGVNAAQQINATQGVDSGGWKFLGFCLGGCDDGNLFSLGVSYTY